MVAMNLLDHREDPGTAKGTGKRTSKMEHVPYCFVVFGLIASLFHTCMKNFEPCGLDCS